VAGCGSRSAPQSCGQARPAASWAAISSTSFCSPRIGRTMTVKLSSFPWSFQGQPSGGRPALPGSVRSAGRRSIAIPAQRVRACSSSTMRRPRGLDLIWRMSPSASASQRWFDARAALTGSRVSVRKIGAIAPVSLRIFRIYLRLLRGLAVPAGELRTRPGSASPRPAVGESALPPICSVAAEGLPVKVGVKEWQICAAVRTHT
jgi:hypothetical protein